MSANGFMEMFLMPALGDHINNSVCKVVPLDVHYLLCLDGHSYRKGTEWIEYYRSTKCQAGVSSTNTSYFLQPCYQNVNRHFKSSIKEIKDDFRATSPLETRLVSFNVACGVHTFERITNGDIAQSLKATGSFPFDEKFLLCFTSNSNVQGIFQLKIYDK